MVNQSSFLLHRVRITSKGYIPTDQDILRAQVRTTGICKYSFDVKGSRYDVYDSGGQRSERKKWIRVFERVHTMVIFVPLGDYDLTLTEDQGCVSCSMKPQIQYSQSTNSIRTA